jgi:hypothetical protein
VRALRFFLDKLYGAAMMVGLAIYLSYTLTALISRLAEPPETLVALAGRQLQMSLLAVAAAATLSAVITARHHRRAGHDLWVTGVRTPLCRSVTLFGAVAVPVLSGWSVFLLMTLLRSDATGDLGYGLLVMGMSLIAVSVGIAFGQVVGLVVPPVAAAPVALAGAYLGSAVFVAAGDDYWWQWLGPAFGDSLSYRPRTLWLVGETAWFTGLTVALLILAAVVGSRPRVVPRVPAVVAGALMVAGGVLLWLNGADASVDPTAFGGP